MKKVSVAVVFILFLTSCFKMGSYIPLEKKVELYWKARVTGQYTFDYNGRTLSLFKDFLSDKTKKHMTEKEFYSRLNFKVLDFEIENIKYNESKTEAEVSVLMTIEFNGYKLQNVPVTDKWIKENGEWKIVLKLQSNPFYTYE